MNKTADELAGFRAYVTELVTSDITDEEFWDKVGTQELLILGAASRRSSRQIQRPVAARIVTQPITLRTMDYYTDRAHYLQRYDHALAMQKMQEA